MQDVGLHKPKARPEGKYIVILTSTNIKLKKISFYLLDIVNMDIKSTLRVLYTLFTKFRDAV